MFNEKLKEYDKEKGELPVWQSPKYIESKEKALSLINSEIGKKAGISEGDFWILMNKTKNDKMAYTGLIISHNGCLKLNSIQKPEKQFKPNSLTLDKDGWGGSIVYTYSNEAQGIYEVGEVSKTNCKNEYPYAMALKRAFDRVVLKVTELAFAGIYSDSEADEFKDPQEEREAPKETKTPIAKGQPVSVASDPLFNLELEPNKEVAMASKTTIETLLKIVIAKGKNVDDFKKWVYEKYKITDLMELTQNQCADILALLSVKPTIANKL